MATSSSTISNPPSDEDLTQLTVCLWAWKLCEKCQSQHHCSGGNCPNTRMKRLAPFFDHYRTWTALYGADTGGPGNALTKHKDLRDIIEKLHANPDVPRAELARIMFPSQSAPHPPPPSVSDQERALDLAVRVSTMIDCSAVYQDLGILEQGLLRQHWRGDMSYRHFISLLFPQVDHPNVNEDDAGKLHDLRTEVTARKLKKRARLQFQPTDDLRCHLQFHRRTRTVDVFHHTAFLKEQLRLTREGAGDPQQLGALPRQLMLEALDSIQKVLFPLADEKSYALLQSLVSSSGFDPDCLRFESTSIRSAEETKISFHYFGARLAELYEESKNPAPHSLLDKWLERKSSARHVMLATLVGVLIAIVLGILSLAVSISQAYIGYQAWKHPVAANSS